MIKTLGPDRNGNLIQDGDIVKIFFGEKELGAFRIEWNKKEKKWQKISMGAAIDILAWNPSLRDMEKVSDESLK